MNNKLYTISATNSFNKNKDISLCFINKILFSCIIKYLDINSINNLKLASKAIYYNIISNIMYIELIKDNFYIEENYIVFNTQFQWLLNKDMLLQDHNNYNYLNELFNEIENLLIQFNEIIKFSKNMYKYFMVFSINIFINLLCLVKNNVIVVSVNTKVKLLYIPFTIINILSIVIVLILLINKYKLNKNIEFKLINYIKTKVLIESNRYLVLKNTNKINKLNIIDNRYKKYYFNFKSLIFSKYKHFYGRYYIHLNFYFYFITVNTLIAFNIYILETSKPFELAILTGLLPLFIVNYFINAIKYIGDKLFNINSIRKKINRHYEYKKFIKKHFDYKTDNWKILVNNKDYFNM